MAAAARTHHAVRQRPQEALLPGVGQELDVAPARAQPVPRVAGVRHLLAGPGAVQPQEAHLHHGGPRKVKLQGGGVVLKKKKKKKNRDFYFGAQTQIALLD